jgi:hypothetical protein
MIRRLFWLSIIATQLAPLAFGQQLSYPRPPATDWKEIFLENEPKQFKDAADLINKLQKEEAKRSGDPIARGFHKKAHASVQAEFKVMDNLPPECRFGMFKESKTYKAWVRISNGLGFLQRDRRADIRGFAFKVVGVEGEKLLPNEANAKTQDFLFHNVKTQLAKDTHQIMALATSGNNPLNIYPHLLATLGFSEANRIAKYLMANTYRHLASVALESWWSGGATKLGPYVIKTILKPMDAEQTAYKPFGPYGYLRDEFKARLKKSDVKWAFYVQFYTDPKRTPFEDDTVEWLETDAPPVKLGELTIHKQDMDSPEYKAAETFAETLAYTPWHATTDLKPVGHMNRSRLAIYEASATLRLNRHSVEPDGSEKFDK